MAVCRRLRIGVSQLGYGSKVHYVVWRFALDVFANNKSAIGLYGRESYSHEGSRRGAVMVGGAEVDWLMLTS